MQTLLENHQVHIPCCHRTLPLALDKPSWRNSQAQWFDCNFFKSEVRLGFHNNCIIWIDLRIRKDTEDESERDHSFLSA
jgi:hypothetical protein